MSEDGDIQGWWEVPSIAHFCSLFRIAFNLLDFDIEDLEEAVLTDAMDEADRGTNPLRLTDLIVRLLQGILEDGSVDKNNYSRHLRKLLQNRWQEEENRANPLSNDKMHFKDLPLRTKVEILHALCDFRLESEDVQELIRNFEAESLRVVPLGKDDKGSTYWYFYGTRLYREDPPPPEDEPGSSSPKRGRPTKKKPPPPPPPNPKKKSISLPIPPRAKWKVVCFTQSEG
ncbi:unnamed protein product [Cyprideis torosa]|uniref:WHIM1 domain-containing protein n=1 Tax=Cyprideis torosa TaxID=163714 RepID=A0A7R8ZLM0_9CRUS|nr:unnamed protein product [Cyprideis torosa]CAG0886988.1 unnamed protein product [Cyprideis torosa]